VTARPATRFVNVFSPQTSQATLHRDLRRDRAIPNSLDFDLLLADQMTSATESVA
jgi:hypothetical protein